MSSITIKNEAKSIIDKMPDDFTWDDLMHEIYVRQTIEDGLKDSETGKTEDVKKIREKYGL